MTAPALSSPLAFRCTSCGNCCRNFRVAVTSRDVARLASASGHAARELVAWLAPDTVDMTGEPESFVELSEGRRLMVLRQRDGACRLLRADNRCGVYLARPQDCRAFPFTFGEPLREAGPRRLALLPLDGCELATDGQHDADAIDSADRARWCELRDYQALVARWNRVAHHRRRLHHPIGTGEAFLTFALRNETAREDRAHLEAKRLRSDVY